MNKIKFWFNNARPTSLPQSLVPSVLAVCMALQADGFSWWLSTCAVLGVMAAHLALNLFDDYFDYIKKQSGYRDELKHEGFRARIGKCPYLTSGQATLKQLLAACVILSIIAFSFGSVVLYFRGDLVLYIVGATILLGFFLFRPSIAAELPRTGRIGHRHDIRPAQHGGHVLCRLRRDEQRRRTGVRAGGASHHEHHLCALHHGLRARQENW